MTLGEDFYSRLVAWMKIILPLAALGLLSTLFLISRTIDPTQKPITEIDLEQRAQEQGATKPTFAGVTSGGDQVGFTAARARPDPRDPERLIADDVQAELRLVRGTIIDITSEHGDMHQSNFTAALNGDVVVETTTGYSVLTDQLNSRFDILYAETPGPVEGYGPPGDITAGKMLLTSDEETGHAELLFTEGVKLIYTPQSSKE